MTTGILLIAIGKPFYKELAYNMALSLRVAGAPHITLITDDGGAYYTPTQRKVFDDFRQADESHLEDNYVHNPFRLKTFINEYSPYDRTLFLDADGLWLYDARPSIAGLLKTLEGYSFTMHQVATYTKQTCATSQMIWLRQKGDPTSNIEKLWDLYGLDDDAVYSETNSSFIYWEKSDENDRLFRDVQHNYMDRKMPFTKVGSYYPDELAWNLTLAQHKRQLGIGARFIFFDYENKTLPIDQIGRHFMFIGLAGGYINNRVVTYYQNLVNNLRLNHGDGIKFKFKMLEKAYHDK